MPSPIAHAVTGYALTQLPPTKSALALHKAFPWLTLWLPLYGTVVSVLPDFDFIPQLITGIRFHRGPSHSLLAALLVSLMLALIIYSIKRQIPYGKLFVFTLICYGTHLAMDAVTTGGAGMMLLWPFSEQYFRAPFSIFPPVRHSRGLWDASHIVFISVELVYSGIVLSALKLIKAKHQRPQNSPESQS